MKKHPFTTPDYFFLSALIGVSLIFGITLGLSFQYQSLFLRDATMNSAKQVKSVEQPIVKNDDNVGNVSQNDSDIKFLENACVDYKNYLQCSMLACEGEACSCYTPEDCEDCEVCEPCDCDDPPGTIDPEDHDDPDFFTDVPPSGLDDQLMVLHNKNIFNDPIGYGCNDRGDNRDHLFNGLRINMSGDTLYTGEYFGGSSFALDNTYMDVESDKSFDFRGSCTYGYSFYGDNISENPSYPCEIGSAYYSTGGDCGGARLWTGQMYGNNHFVLYPGTYLGGNPYTIMKGSGEAFSVVANVWRGSSDNKPRATGGRSLVGSGVPEYDAEMVQLFMGKNGRWYGIVKDKNQVDPPLFRIYDYTDMGAPVYLQDVENGTELYTLLTLQYNPFGTKAFHGSQFSAEPYYTVLHVRENAIDIYDITNPMDVTLLGSVPENGLFRNENFATGQNVFRIYDTVYIWGQDHVLYQYVINADTAFVPAFSVGNTNQIRVTKDHILFRLETDNGMNMLTAVNLKTGNVLMDSVPIPDSYADFGNRTVKHNIYDWVVTRQGVNYYLYAIRSQQIEGGPNYIQALKIGAQGTGTLIDEICRPQCQGANVCGQPDGCGNYCMNDNYVDGNYLPACSEPYHKCRTNNYMTHGLDTAEPYCQCTLGDSAEGCSPGSTYCEWTERNSGSWGLCPSYADGAVDVIYYTCEGSSASCSRYESDKVVECYLSRVQNCNYIGNNTPEDPWGSNND